jgi:hypothetical protein
MKTQSLNINLKASKPNQVLNLKKNSKPANVEQCTLSLVFVFSILSLNNYRIWLSSALGSQGLKLILKDYFDMFSR